MPELTIVLDGLPVSVNEAYAGKINRYRSKAYKDLEKLWAISIMRQARKQFPGMRFPWDETTWFTVWMELWAPNWTCKNGRIRKVDAPNYEKVTMDIVCPILKHDDSQHRHTHISKMDGEAKKTILRFETLNL